MKNWKFASIIEVDKEFKVDNYNIWNYYWECVDKKVEVKGPFEGQVYFFKEYVIKGDYKTIHFVVGEFINNQIGIYLKDDLTDGKL